VTAVLPCDNHPEFWQALGLEQLEPGATEHLAISDLSKAWSVMPITPPDAETT
jgi:hypothetical protein